MKATVLRLLALAVVGILVVFAGCRYTPPPETRQQAVYPERLEKEPSIRVQIAEFGTPVQLLISGAYTLEVMHLGGRKETGGGTSGLSIQAEASGGGVKMGQDLFEQATVRPVGACRLGLRTRTDKASTGQEFKGALVFSRTPEGKLLVVTEMGLEEYLVGVVPHEMPAGWGTEALKAQAVAARSYALYHIKTGSGKAYDVKSSVFSQVWKPVERADPRAALAVNSTRGLVVTENHRLFPAYFHSRCGGRTADARFVFQQGDITALSGVDCKFCMSRNAPPPWNPGFRIALEELGDRLKQQGLISGSVRSIVALSEDKQPQQAMKRVYWMKVTTDRGTEYVLPADRFRRAVGHDKQNLPSTWFAVTNNATYATFEGRGHGHGVGMCQYGARYLAEQLGYDYTSILQEYYPGCTVVKLY